MRKCKINNKIKIIVVKILFKDSGPPLYLKIKYDLKKKLFICLVLVTLTR